MKKRVPKTRAGGTMTESAYLGFIRSTLRRASLRWRPRQMAKVAARWPVKLRGHTKRLVYHSTCAECKKLFPEADGSVDHKDPVVNPKVGFVCWDTYIDRLFCELPNWQVLCSGCHDKKSKGERQIAAERRKNELK